MALAKDKSKKNKRPAIVVRGTLVYPFLNKPRQYKGAGDYFYSTKIVVTGDEAERLKEFVAVQRQTWADKCDSSLNPALGYKPNPEGEGILVNSKMKSEIKSKKHGLIQRKPIILDAHRKPIANPKLIGSGTEARVKLEAYAWDTGSSCGITLQPKLVQLIKLVEYVPGLDLEGFDDVEGGYVPEDEDPLADDSDEVGSSDDDEQGSDF